MSFVEIWSAQMRRKVSGVLGALQNLCELFDMDFEHSEMDAKWVNHYFARGDKLGKTWLSLQRF